MPDSFILVALIEYSIVILMFGYASFWAFNIRRALFVNLYRNQALGTGLLAILLPLTFVVVAANLTGNTPANTPVPLLAFLSVFYFIDSTVRAARRSDPALRDTFHWSSLRLYLWPILLLLIALSALSPLLLPTNSPEGILASGAPYLLGLGTGIVVLPTSGRRSGDRNLRSHLKWFGLFAGFVLFHRILEFTSGEGSNPLVIGLHQLAFVAFLTAGFCLYRSARSLAPINKLTISES
jgi:hypothetical protein